MAKETFIEPKPVEKPNDGYVYTGEQNYEPPKADPWTVEKK